ncbi:Hypothetical predicted protein, partial [Marmota monax]
SPNPTPRLPSRLAAKVAHARDTYLARTPSCQPLFEQGPSERMQRRLLNGWELSPAKGKDARAPFRSFRGATVAAVAHA